MARPNRPNPMAQLKRRIADLEERDFSREKRLLALERDFENLKGEFHNLTKMLTDSDQEIIFLRQRIQSILFGPSSPDQKATRHALN